MEDLERCGLGRQYQNGYYTAAKTQLMFFSMISSWFSTVNVSYFHSSGTLFTVEVNESPEPLSSQITV